jgi:hypothetical protein
MKINLKPAQERAFAKLRNAREKNQGACLMRDEVEALMRFIPTTPTREKENGQDDKDPHERN